MLHVRLRALRIGVFVFSCVAFLLSSFLYTYAQEGLAITVQPTIVEERLDPGQTAQGQLTVTNNDGGKQTYFVGTRNVTGMEQSGRPLFAEADAADDPLAAAKWITPQVTTFTLEVGESAQVPYRIDVPADASPGGYFAAIFITREADALTESGAGVGFHVASLINLRINGDVVEDMVLKEFFTGKALYTAPPIDFSVRIENTGTVHDRPQGIITITDMLGNDVGQVSINETGGAILPRTERLFVEPWSHEGFTMGRYHARASLVFGDTAKQTITRDTSFWIIPVRELVYALGGLLLLVLTFVFGVRAYVRRVLRSVGQDTTRAKEARAQASFAQKLMKTVLWFIALIILAVVSMLIFFA